VAAVLRRIGPTPEAWRPDSAVDARKVLRCGDLQLDLTGHRCRLEQQELVLTVTEFDLLRVLIASPGRVFSRGQLIEQAYGSDHHVTERTVDSHVRRLRRKLADAGADPIETVYGIGYRMREPAAGSG
jgi:two-component system OmpR family response regulator